MSSASPVTCLIGRGILFLSRCAAIVLSFALLATPFNPSGFQEISDGMYDSGTPLMGSRLLEYLMHPWFTVILGVLILVYVYIRFRFISREHRRLSDLAYLVMVSILMMGLQFGLYFPVVQSTVI